MFFVQINIVSILRSVASFPLIERESYESHQVYSNPLIYVGIIIPIDLSPYTMPADTIIRPLNKKKKPCLI